MVFPGGSEVKASASNAGDPGSIPGSGRSPWTEKPGVSSSVVPFSSCPQSFPASGTFQMSQLSASGGQSIGVSDLASVLPMNTQD